MQALYKYLRYYLDNFWIFLIFVYAYYCNLRMGHPILGAYLSEDSTWSYNCYVQ